MPFISDSQLEGPITWPRRSSHRKGDAVQSLPRGGSQLIGELPRGNDTGGVAPNTDAVEQTYHQASHGMDECPAMPDSWLHNYNTGLLQTPMVAMWAGSGMDCLSSLNPGESSSATPQNCNPSTRGMCNESIYSDSQQPWRVACGREISRTPFGSIENVMADCQPDQVTQSNLQSGARGSNSIGDRKLVAELLNTSQPHGGSHVGAIGVKNAEKGSNVPTCLLSMETSAPSAAGDAVGVYDPLCPAWTGKNPMLNSDPSLTSSVPPNTMGNIGQLGSNGSITRHDEVAMQLALEATLSQQHMVQAVLQALGALTVQQAVSTSFMQLPGQSTSRPSRPPGKPKDVPICYDYVQGKCNRRNCRYSHDMERIIMHNSSEKGICFDHLRGECKRGAMCRFSHNLKDVAQQSVGEHFKAREESTSNVGKTGRRTSFKNWVKGICYDFVRGACTRGSQCPWSHDLMEIAMVTKRGGRGFEQPGKAHLSRSNPRLGLARPIAGQSNRVSHKRIWNNGGVEGDDSLLSMPHEVDYPEILEKSSKGDRHTDL